MHTDGRQARIFPNGSHYSRARNSTDDEWALNKKTKQCSVNLWRTTPASHSGPAPHSLDLVSTKEHGDDVPEAIRKLEANDNAV